MNHPSWPRWLVVAGVAVGLAVAISVFAATRVMLAPAVVALVLTVTQTFGASLAALGLLVGAAVARLRNRPWALAGSLAPRVVMIIAGLTTATAAALMFGLSGGAVAADQIVIGLAGLAVAFAALVRWPRPWGPAATVLALLIVVVGVEANRETGGFTVGANRTKTRTTSQQESEHTCTSARHGTPAGRFEGTASRAELRVALGGNVGSKVQSTVHAGPGPVPGHAVFDVRGTASVSWLACWVPLYKQVELQGQLTLTGTVVSPSGERCTARADVTLTMQHRSLGIQSCHALREQLARDLGGQIRRFAEASLR
jgi:hypothetical protein